MKNSFSSFEEVRIGSGAPNVVSSSITVEGLTGSISRVAVAVAIDHTFTGDLVVVLEAPSGRTVVLARNVGGSGDDMIAEFSDEAPFSISEGRAPFAAEFRPAEPLAELVGEEPNGVWTLHVVDQQFRDGGSLLGWRIEVTTGAAPSGGHPIDVVFRGGLTASQQDAFVTAAVRWSEVLRESAPAVQVGEDIIQGVRIEAAGVRIDGPSGILGQAGPRALRSGTLIPATGIMEFDTADLAEIELNGGLVDVIVHEMGHVLGIGTLWSQKFLIGGTGTANPTFLGDRAQHEFAALVASETPLPVPLANTGGAGTREGHWRESVFGSELMTGFINSGVNPLSRLTLASLGDVGYEVNIEAADNFVMPTALQLAMLGVGSDRTFQHCCTLGHSENSVGPVILPTTAERI